jgi:predicted aspartyl protease
LVRGVLLTLFFALIAGRAAAAEPVAVAPYRIDYYGWFTVSVTVNGLGPYDFIIDTGATQSLVFDNLANMQTFPRSDGPPQLVLGLASQGRFPTYVVGDVAIGAARLDKLVTVILGDWKLQSRSPQGVLGLDFLSKYEVLFDREKMEMRLYPLAPGKPAGSERWKEVPLEASDFGLDAGILYTVPAKAQYRKLSFLLDLGASGTVINHAGLGTITRSEYSINAGPSGRSGRITDALESTADVKAVLVRRFEAGKARWYKQIFVVHDAPIFSDLGQAGRPYGLFGADLVHDYSFAFDFAERQMLIGPKKAGAKKASQKPKPPPASPATSLVPTDQTNPPGTN